jgi:hypothetical protein
MTEPQRMNIAELRAAALARYRSRFQMEADEQEVRTTVRQMAQALQPPRQTREAVQAWIDEHLEEFSSEFRLTDAEREEVGKVYRASVFAHVLRHVDFIAAQHAQEIADLAIPPLEDGYDE